LAKLGYLYERAAAGLLHIVAVRSNCENVQASRTHFFLSTK
jgi:hypothetical protein